MQQVRSFAEHSSNQPRQKSKNVPPPALVERQNPNGGFPQICFQQSSGIAQSDGHIVPALMKSPREQNQLPFRPTSVQ